MARYIDADLLKSKFEYNDNDSPVYVEATKGIHKIIDACHTAEVAPVIHAKWIYKNYLIEHYFECSNCLFTTIKDTRYCSHCGAKMDREEDKEDD